MSTGLAELDFESLVRSYGYVAIVFGTVFEGEATMLAAGAAAHRGLLQPYLVIASGMLGTFISDIFCFSVGRLSGQRLARWFPRTFERVADAFRMMDRFHNQLIVWHQFVPGLCTITPLAFGMSDIRASRFVFLNVVGNCLWTVTYTIAGFGLAAAWQVLADYISPVWLAFAVGLSLAAWIFRLPLRRKLATIWRS